MVYSRVLRQGGSNDYDPGVACTRVEAGEVGRVDQITDLQCEKKQHWVTLDGISWHWMK